MRLTILDGGAGTMLQAAGLQPGKDPADWNLENPRVVENLHRAYVAAGAEVVLTNTFGTNRIKYHGPHDLEKLISAAVSVARRSGAQCVALDLGPTGRLLAPVGDLSFDEAAEAYAEVVRIGAKAGADLVMIETVSDLYELKAAVTAAKESCDLPIYATVTLNGDGKLLTGGSVDCVAALLEGLRVDAYGFNCGMGPEDLLPFVRRLRRLSTRPIIAKPNAGLPKVVNGQTVFSVGPAAFASQVARLIEAGASIVGGCCGTTPAHIEGLSKLGQARTFEKPESRTEISSSTSTVTLRPSEGLIVGERINPTGKRLLKEAFAKGDTAYVLREAVRQVDAGARILDVNCGVPGLDETILLDATVQAVQSVVGCPVQVDTASPEALERALRHVNGKPLVNSVNGKRESMEKVFPLVRKYGGVIVGLCLDEQGIPPTSEGRLAVARKILAEGEKFGFGKGDFVFDALTLAVSADPTAAVVTLETVRRLTEELGVNTILGVSNVSFGLPNRAVLNNTMYALAKRAGLSAAIANPSVIRDEIDRAAEDVLLGRDPQCARWISLVPSTSQATQACQASRTSQTLSAAIVRGLKEDACSAAGAAVASGKPPMALIEGEIVPALEQIGRGFEEGRVFLPGLLMAADAASAAFGVVSSALAARTLRTHARPIVLATVKGDIHDIGKNIVRVLLESYGFEVVDLGRDVPPERIVEAAARCQAKLVGLSALMTTTVGAMEDTIRQLKAAGLACKTVVGGAVVTQEFADSIGADFYAKDAMRTVRIAETL